MAVETVVVQWCDLCFKKDHKRVDATWSEPVRVGKAEGRLELCDEHKAKVSIDKIVDLIATYAERLNTKPTLYTARDRQRDDEAAEGKPVQAASNGEKHLCPSPECQHEAPNRQALGSHVRNVHKSTLGILEAEAGIVRDNPRPVLNCPECGEPKTGAQGLAAHRRNAHPVEYAASRATAA